MLVSEIFLSIQGESSYSGWPCVFIRLAGCNLSCDWCDTDYARGSEGGTEMTIDEVLTKVSKFEVSLVEVTGGEPLFQDETIRLTEKLINANYEVLLETNGTKSFKGLSEEVVKIVDIKCPSSGQEGSFEKTNLELINPNDEVKFVIKDRVDYESAKDFTEKYILSKTKNILFAPVSPELKPETLAQWILKDRLKVRLQLQIHKYIWAGKK
ncbi:MAG: radical SAM protein [Deltaproteobacteria bacterium]|nr:radical SAM protein [Deltaproteobacteria bacterium]